MCVTPWVALTISPSSSGEVSANLVTYIYSHTAPVQVKSSMFQRRGGGPIQPSLVQICLKLQTRGGRDYRNDTVRKK